MSDLFGNSLIVVTAEACEARWACGKPGEKFRCGFCGHKFVVGDLYRALYTNDMPGYGLNPLVCEKCDDVNSVLRAKWKSKIDRFMAVVKAPENWKMLSFIPNND